MEIGVFTFADVREGQSAERRLREVIEEAELADEVGLDVFGVGEHHRPEFAVSAPAVVLAAAAARTKRIRMTSTVTVLSSAVPIRLYQQFATLDLLADGRAEMMVGRGSFTESFPLFGFDLRDYDRLFEDKLLELLRIRETNQSPAGHGVYPHPEEPIPIWVAVGGTPESAVRAGMLGLPMALAIIGGLPERFTPFAELHRRGAAEAGHDPPRLSIGRERGWPSMTRADYDAAAELRGANFVGTPEQVAEKILYQHRLFGHDRFLLQLGIGGTPHEGVLRSIELLGREVAPAVRGALG
jgi:alkanesulfonate monooxygenase SsuD/methylene tetrahydromethanopterin reductase-like flavin-dependent oxidoreductase (luciferase family)